VNIVNQSANRFFDYCDLGMIDYQLAWNLQKEVFDLRYRNEINDTLFLLEHTHTYTLGKIAEKENLVSTQEQLIDLGIKVYEIDRGGDITYHGPGQIVGYPIINLSEWKEDTHQYLRGLEEVIIRTCSDYNLEAGRNPKYTGVWIGDKKIAAIGIKVSRWITMHGFAFNVNTDLSYFSGIIPCGIKDKDVTSLKRELGNDVDLTEVKSKLANNFKIVFEYKNFITTEKNMYLKEFEKISL